MRRPKHFLNINKLADNLYTKFKKDPSVKIPKKPKEWNGATRATEAKLSAALTSAVSIEIMQTAVAISQGFGDISLEDDSMDTDITEYPMSLIILYAILDHLKPGTAEIRKILTGYVRSPPPQEDAGEVMTEIIRWKRAQNQARAMNIQNISTSEYLEALVGIFRPLTNTNKVLNTLLANMDADTGYHDPTHEFVRSWEERIVYNIKMMRAGHCGESETTPTVMQAAVTSPEPSKQNTKQQFKRARTIP